jgi:hypothetical protein
MRSLGTVTIPAGSSRNNSSTGAATLDCSGLAGHNFDTVIMATQGGTQTPPTFSLTGDSAGGDGVTISVSGNAVSAHYESGVSTVADVEAAIAALSTSTATGLIAVDVPGTGATVLATPTDDFTANALSGGATGAFDIPLHSPGLYVLAAEAGVYYRGLPSQATPSVLVATNADFPLTSGQAFGESVGRYGTAFYTAFYNSGGSTATVEVFQVNV